MALFFANALFFNQKINTKQKWGFYSEGSVWTTSSIVLNLTHFPLCPSHKGIVSFSPAQSVGMPLCQSTSNKTPQETPAAFSLFWDKKLTDSIRNLSTYHGIRIKAAGSSEALFIEFLMFFVFEFNRHFVPPSGSVIQGNHRLGKAMTSISALIVALLGAGRVHSVSIDIFFPAGKCYLGGECERGEQHPTVSRAGKRRTPPWV